MAKFEVIQLRTDVALVEGENHADITAPAGYVILGGGYTLDRQGAELVVNQDTVTSDHGPNPATFYSFTCVVSSIPEGATPSVSVRAVATKGSMPLPTIGV